LEKTLEEGVQFQSPCVPHGRSEINCVCRVCHPEACRAHWALHAATLLSTSQSIPRVVPIQTSRHPEHTPPLASSHLPSLLFTSSSPGRHREGHGSKPAEAYPTRTGRGQRLGGQSSSSAFRPAWLLACVSACLLACFQSKDDAESCQNLT